MGIEENISKQTAERLELIYEHLSNLQNFCFQEDSCWLTTGSNKVMNVLPAKPPRLRRMVALLTAKMASYPYLYRLYRRRIEKIIHIDTRAYFSDEVIYGIKLAIRRLLDRLCWYLRLNPEQEIRRGPYTLETRIFVHQAYRRINIYKYTTILFPSASILYSMIAYAVFDFLQIYTRYRVSSLEIALLYLGFLFLGYSSLSLVLSILSVGMLAFDLIFVLAQFQPPNHGEQI